MVALIIVICLIVFIGVMFITYKISNKKNKNKIIQAESNAQKLTSILSVTNQHFKYENKITLQTIITNIAELILALSIFFLYVLPIFQIKLELLDISIAKKNFSFIETYITIIKEHDNSAHFYTDVDVSDSDFIISCFFLALIFIFIITCFFCMPFKIKKNTEKVFLSIKLDKKSYIDKFDFIFYLFFIGFLIYLVINSKNAEYKVSSNITYTIENIDNYLYYYTNNGELAFRVYQNNFKFCNGVSGYIAIPIILFIIGLILYFVGQYLKRQLVNDISKEKIEGFEDTAEN